MTLDDWLAHCERLHPQAIEMGLGRVETVRTRLNLKFTCPLVVVAGTNGKGSSCAMLESIALAAGWRVGLYSKPHLVHFEERCRVQGASVAAEALLPHFAAVEAVRGDVALTYFEFTTLAIARALACTELDLVILEVGLGGRLDAVNVFDADCALITSIDIDHTDFLGPDRESIGREKAGIMRAGRPVVVSDPVPPASLTDRARELGADLRRAGVDFSHSGDRQQWNWRGVHRRWSALAYPALRGANQLLNASGVLAVFEALGDRLPVSAQAVRQGLATVDLPGRFQVLPGQPLVVLDVAHNAQSAAVLAQNLDQLGFAPRTHAVFGAMADKDLPALIEKLLPMVDVWHLCDLPLPRAARAADLGALLARVSASAAFELHASPEAALAAARLAADPADRIVVYGSFLTVGGVLKAHLPGRSSARV